MLMEFRGKPYTLVSVPMFIHTLIIKQMQYHS